VQRRVARRTPRRDDRLGLFKGAGWHPWRGSAVEPVTEEDAANIARLRPIRRQAGIGLGDRDHLMDRLAVAPRIVEPDVTDQERKDRLNAWTDLFDTMGTAIDYIEQMLIKGYDAVRGDNREVLWDHLRFMRNNKDRMRYVTLHRAGLPVSSGVTESTCKTVLVSAPKEPDSAGEKPGCDATDAWANDSDAVAGDADANPQARRR
jgi:hypothetical protein